MFNIDIRKNIKLFCAFLSIPFLISGCGAFSEKVPNPLADLQQSSESSQQYAAALLQQGIELPESRTKIFVNQTGYSAQRPKKVMFFGDEHGDTFRVVRKSDKETVYTGNILVSQKDTLSGVQLGTGDFSQVTETGIYYIESDIVGQSYPFAIAQDAYESFFLSLLENVSNVKLEESAESVCNVSFGMDILMYSLQCSGSVYEEAYAHLSNSGYDDDMVTELLHMAQWLLSQQDGDGSLYEDYDATAAFCGAITMSLNTFGIYQDNVAKEYRSAAEKAWQWLEKQDCDTKAKKAAQFYAAAQLFKSEGTKKYNDIILNFFENEPESYSDNRFIFHGIIAYMGSESAPDRDLCTRIMIKLVDETEKISIDARKDDIFGTGERSVEKCLDNMRLLGFTNYITPNKEYTAIIENTIQYIGGLNETGNSYISADGVWQETDNAAGRNFEWNGIILFVYSNMLQNLSDMENGSTIEAQ